MSEEQKKTEPNYSEKVPARTWPALYAVAMAAIIYLYLAKETAQKELLAAKESEIKSHIESENVKEDYANRMEKLYFQREQLIAFASRLRIDSSLLFDAVSDPERKRPNRP